MEIFAGSTLSIAIWNCFADASPLLNCYSGEMFNQESAFMQIFFINIWELSRYFGGWWFCKRRSQKMVGGMFRRPQMMILRPQGSGYVPPGPSNHDSWLCSTGMGYAQPLLASIIAWMSMCTRNESSGLYNPFQLCCIFQIWIIPQGIEESFLTCHFLLWKLQLLV